MLKYEEVTLQNLILATEIQMKIFPKESAYLFYKHIIERNNPYEKSYIVYDSNKIIGVTGFYCNEDLNETHSLWLNWYGILEEYRKQGYGKQVLIDTFAMARTLARKYPIKYIRLYTTTVDNKVSNILYDEIMDIKETYHNDNDSNYNNTCLIYSKSLFTEPVPYWNNSFLNIRKMVEEEQESNKLWQRRDLL